MQPATALIAVGIEREAIIDPQWTKERHLESHAHTDAVFEVAEVEVIRCEPDAARIEETV